MTRAIIPDTTSAEAFDGYVDGRLLLAGRGRAWREIKASLFSYAGAEGGMRVPAVSEPLLHWVAAGGMEVREREDDGQLFTSSCRRGTFYLTAAGAAYDCHWRRLSPEPCEVMIVSVSLPLFQRALAEVFGADAARARLQDVSGFEDAVLHSLFERLREELLRGRRASTLCVQGLAQVIATHLARNYTAPAAGAASQSPSLPGHKLRRITGHLAAHLADAPNLDELAALAGLSKFYFQRLFKNALGVSPLRYLGNLRLETARRLLRETPKSVVEISLEVGYESPSHFTQLFRRETGLTPGEYRRRR